MQKKAFKIAILLFFLMTIYKGHGDEAKAEDCTKRESLPPGNYVYLGKRASDTVRRFRLDETGGVVWEEDPPSIGNSDLPVPSPQRLEPQESPLSLDRKDIPAIAAPPKDRSRFNPFRRKHESTPSQPAMAPTYIPPSSITPRPPQTPKIDQIDDDFDVNQYPTIKWKLKEIATMPGAYAQVTTKFERSIMNDFRNFNKVRYKIIVTNSRVAPSVLRVQFLDREGFKIGEIQTRYGEFAPIPNTSLFEANGDTSWYQEDTYRKARGLTIK